MSSETAIQKCMMILLMSGITVSVDAGHTSTQQVSAASSFHACCHVLFLYIKIVLPLKVLLLPTVTLVQLSVFILFKVELLLHRRKLCLTSSILPNAAFAEVIHLHVWQSFHGAG